MVHKEFYKTLCIECHLFYLRKKTYLSVYELQNATTARFSTLAQEM